MTPTNYQPVRGLTAPKGTVTNFDWCVGGETASNEPGRYKISVFKPWYVYKRKPEGPQFQDARRLPSGLWVSQGCNGDQIRSFYQRGVLDGLKVWASTTEEATKIARELVFATGYVRPFHYPELRQPRIVRSYHLGIRCAGCGITRAEVGRKRLAYSWKLRWPKDGPFSSSGISSWEADQMAKQAIGCRCEVAHA